MPYLIREKPPLRLDYDLETPSGRHYHWSEQESDPASVPSGLSFSTTIPGGFENMDATLPRKRGVAYADLERLSTVTVYGPGADIAWQGRLERVPRSSGDKLSVSPGCVGWQAHLDDDKSAAMVYVDRDLSRWGGISRARRVNLLASSIRVEDGRLEPDTTTGIPSLTLVINGDGTTGRRWCQMLYDAGPGLKIASVYYDVTDDNILAATWEERLAADDTDTAVDFQSSDFSGSDSSGTFTPASACRFIHAWIDSNGATLSNGGQYTCWWRRMALFGDHGLTKRGTAPDQGFYASDIVAHAVGEWCPLLNYSTGSDGTIRPSTFVIPHLAFHEQTSAAEIIRQATRFGLQDWAVWDNRTFYWHDRGELGRSWRARASESQLTETGESSERLYNGVVVEFKDVDGTTKTVGPTGSGADAEDTDLEDDDTENPANQLGINRWTKLQMGVSTTAGATEVGRRFLEETKQLDSSGQAKLVGHVYDDRGVCHPAWRVRAGDTISFVDSSDTSSRRVIRTQYDHPSRTCSIDIDAPPEGLDALLERLNVVLTPLGL